MAGSRKKIAKRVIDEYEELFGVRPADLAETPLVEDDDGRMATLIANLAAAFGIEEDLEEDSAETLEELVTAIQDVWDGETLDDD